MAARLRGAARIARLALTQLMDRELPDVERARVRSIAESHPEVTAVHDIRTRGAGPTAFIQLHSEMDGAMMATGRVDIMDEARVTGRVISPKFMLAEGATFNGKVEPQHLDTAMRVARHRRAESSAEVEQARPAAAAASPAR